MNICDLNDDCLLHIFQFLTPAEKIKLWLSCQRFSALLAPWIQRCRLFLREIWRGIPLAEAMPGFISCGWSIKSLFLRLETNEDIEMCKLLLPHCSGLHILTVCFKGADTSDAENAVRIQDGLCQVIETLSTLKVLNIRCSMISGQHLSNLTNLQELNLAWSSRLEPKYLTRILLANPHLTKLNISKCKRLITGFSCPLITQRRLESLVIDEVNYSSLYMPALKNVKSFSTIWNNSDGNRTRSLSFLQQLSQSRGDLMRSLEIDAFEARLDNEIFRSISSFRNLTRLSLKWLRNVAQDGFLTQISQACKMLEELLIWDSTTRIKSEDAFTCVRNLKYLRKLLTYESYWFDADVFKKLVEIRRSNDVTMKPLLVVLVDILRENGMCEDDEYGEFLEFKCKYVQVILSGSEPDALM